jgi:XTP/dITP diphosphohydrolase
MKLYFVTTNENKAAEALAFFSENESPATRSIELCVVRHDVQEIMHPKLEEVVRHKALEAYRYLRQPCLVEHGGLFFEALPDLPGPLGKLIWNAVGDRMCGFLRDEDARTATARAIIGYCDGRRIRLYNGETAGEVAHAARGDYNTSNWDPIFIPDGSTETYGEMGRARKRATSPLTKAWERFLTEGLADHAAGSLARRGSPA